MRSGQWVGEEWGTHKGSCSLTQGAPLAEREVDCLWDKRFSEPVAEEVDVGASLPRVRGEEATGQVAQCLQVELEVVGSQPARALNKVKLYNLALY